MLANMGPIRGVFMICMEMFGNGLPMPAAHIHRAPRRTHSPLALLAEIVFYRGSYVSFSEACL